MESLEQIKSRIESAVTGAQLEIIPNRSSGNADSLLVDAAHAVAVAQFLRDDPQLRLGYLSNVTGVDWPDTVIKEKTRVTRQIDGQEVEVDEVVETVKPGCLEVIYHLYSMSLKHGPVILRMRTGNRASQTRLPSLTPVYRGAELQEREVYDLFGVIFDGHPDLRRLLMWEAFEGFPMRKDYQAPDDFEYEPTPHGAVLQRATQHYQTKNPNA